MKYLYKYNEAISYIGTSPMKLDIQDILLELKDEGFECMVQIGVDDKNELCKVEISKENKFDYSEIEETIERIKDYMTDNNFYVDNFSHVLHGSIYNPSKIPYVMTSLTRQFNRFGNGRWTELHYYFEIKFKNIPSANEELKSDTYKSAADKLSKLGHKQRPEELMKWSDIVKKKEEDAIKKQVLDDVSQFGKFTCFINVNSNKSIPEGIFVGDFYIKIYFDYRSFEAEYQEWSEYSGSLSMPFEIGIIPATKESQEFCETHLDPILGKSWDRLTYWVSTLWIPISDTYELDADGNPIFTPPKMVNVWFNEWDIDWNLATRKSAIDFRDSLYKFFKGDIILGELPDLPGGIKETIIEELCINRNHTIEEYEEIMNSIKKINLNKLYKD